MSVAVILGGVAGDSPVEPVRGPLVSALFTPHRRVAVRLAGGAAGPQFCTCGDVWPCRVEEAAARLLDLPG